MQFVSCCLFALLMLLSRPAAAQCGWQPGEGVAGVRGGVSVFLPWDPDGPEGSEEELLVVGGGFIMAGDVQTPNIAVWRPSDRTWEELGGGLGRLLPGYGGVSCLAELPDRRLVAGGTFYGDEGEPTTYVSVWDGARWTSISNGLSGSVRALVVTADGTLIAGGEFQVATEDEPTAIAAWNGTSWTAIDGGWMDGYFSKVTNLAVLPDGRLAAAGWYYNDYWEVSASLAFWDGVEWTPSFNVSGEIQSMFLTPDHRLVIAPSGSGRAASWLQGGTWTHIPIPYGSGAPLATSCDADGVIIASFHSIPWHSTEDFTCRWSGTEWIKLGSGRRRGVVRAQTSLSDGTLVLANKNYSGTSCYIELWDGEEWMISNSGMSEPVLTIAPRAGGGAYVGGEFRWAFTNNCMGVAAFDGEQWSALGDALSPGGTIGSLMVDSLGQLLAAGSFDVGTPPPSSVGTWTGDAWDVASLPVGGVGAGIFRMFSGFDGRPSVLAGNLYELVEDAWQRTDLGLGGVTYAAIYVEKVGLVVGGHFNTVNGQSARSVVTWDRTAWHAMGSGMNSAVYALLAHSDGGTYAGGNFASAGSATTRAVARWDGTDWTAVGGGLGLHAEVRALAELPNGDIIAAGEFTTAGGIPANNIARWDGSQWHPLGGGTNGAVRALAVLEDGSLAVGGDFTHVDGKPSAYFARYVFPGSPPAITTQPVDAFACMNTPAAFTVVAGGDASHQWQIADPLAPDGWSDLSDGELDINGKTIGFVEGANTGTLRFAPVAATFHAEVRCVVSGQCASARSDPASLSVCRADVDCDGLLSDLDFFMFFDAFLACDGSPPGCVSGATDPDFNSDAVVDIMDFLEYLDSYGSGCF